MRKYFVFLSISILFMSKQSLHAQIYIFFEGIEGEGKLVGFPGSTEINSFSWGVNNKVSTSAGTGLSAGKAEFGAIKFQKLRDITSSFHQTNVFTGKRIPKAEIRFYKDRSIAPYLTIFLEDVIVSGLEIVARGGLDPIMETLSLNYTRIRTEEAFTKPGVSPGKINRSGWDLSANRVF